MRKLSWLLLAAFFFLNPGFACGPMEPEFQYGAKEMRAAIEGNWAVTITPTGGAAQDYVVTLKQAMSASPSATRAPERAFVRAAHACGDRTLLASANACVSSTIMPLTVTVAPGGPTIAGPNTGSFAVHALTFGQGELYLSLGERQVSATIDQDGATLSANTSGGTATLRRLP